jgi:diadenosine tetraphosphate (Ap4A) HIT family hydrolase
MHSSLLQLPESSWISSNELAFAVRAPNPVCPGHAIVALRRLVPSYSDTSAAERAALWALVDAMKRRAGPLETYEASFTTGEVAGEAVPEAAVHVIPRARQNASATDGPVQHPTESRRPSAASHRAPPLATGGDHDPLAAQLWPLFADASEIAIVAAFVTGVASRCSARGCSRRWALGPTCASSRETTSRSPRSTPSGSCSAGASPTRATPRTARLEPARSGSASCRRPRPAAPSAPFTPRPGSSIRRAPAPPSWAAAT